MKKIVKIISVFIVAAALAAAAVSFAWHKGAFLPGWISWQEKEEIYALSGMDTENTDNFEQNTDKNIARNKYTENENISDEKNLANETKDADKKTKDIDKDTNTDTDIKNIDKTIDTGSISGQLEFTLKDKHLELDKDNTILWTSPKDILVQDFLWCDINHDDKAELLILCWRIGRYGNAKPYWVEKDEHAWSQHIYIYELRDNEEIHPLWMASDIGMDVRNWSFDDNERLVITETSGRRTVWDWVSWGLSLIKVCE